MKKKLAVLTLITLFGFFTLGKVQASEGIIQMEATDDSGAKCFITSLLMTSFEYQLLLSCKGHNYPPGPGLFQYAAWADVTVDNDPQYLLLGTLGVGKRSFIVPKKFSRIIITKEAGSEPAEPSDYVFMIGSVEPIAFLEGAGAEVVAKPTATPTATPKSSESESQDNETDSTQDDEAAAKKAEATQKAASSAGGAVRVIAAFVILAVIGIVAIAVVSASRRKPINI